MSMATVFIVVLFSIIGFAVFRYGRKTNEPRPLVLGVLLMGYGYFISNAWLSLLVGTVLTLLVFFPQ